MSVVTRDVPAYAIVAGASAKIIRSRFSEDVATRLAEMAWWDWPLDRLFEAIPDMQNLKIEEFIEKWSD